MISSDYAFSFRSFLPEIRLAAPLEALVALALAVVPVPVGRVHPLLLLRAAVTFRRGLSRRERMVSVDLDRLLYEALDGLELTALLRRHERDRRAGLACARGAPDAVHIRLGLQRKLHVYDAVYVRHVDAAACDTQLLG